MSTDEELEACASDVPLPYAEMYYKLGVAAYDSEKSMQGHLWGRFRDTVSLMVVVATAHGAALFALAKPGYSLLWFILCAAIVLISCVFMAMSIHALSTVYDGADYCDQIPQETQKVVLKNGTALMGYSLVNTAEALFKCAEENYKINSERSRILSDARRFLMLALFALPLVWLVVLGGTMRESHEVGQRPVPEAVVPTE